MTTFGPGTLTIGATGSEVDASCLVNKLRITATVDAGDPTTKLCGTVRAGTRTYGWEMTGNVDIDPELGLAGLFGLSQSAYGTEQAFEFTPNTDAVASVTGTLIIDPLDFGADEFGADMTSDLTWTLVGPPVYTYPPPAVADEAQAPVTVDA